MHWFITHDGASLVYVDRLLICLYIILDILSAILFFFLHMVFCFGVISRAVNGTKGSYYWVYLSFRTDKIAEDGMMMVLKEKIGGKTKDVASGC